MVQGSIADSGGLRAACAAMPPMTSRKLHVSRNRCHLGRLELLLVILVICSLFGCSRIGPSMVTRDSFDYVSTISESWKNQMLLNLVKLRYADTPFFLDVSSVISQYELSSEVNATLGWDLLIPGETSQTLGGSGLYAERPTITYVPVVGAKFTENLLTPIPPSAVLFLVQAGYPVRLVFGMCVRTLNDLDNHSVDPLWAREADPEFERLVDLLERLQRASAVAIRVEQRGDAKTVVMAMRRRRADTADRGALARILGLDPAATEYQVTYGAVARSDREVAMQTRSLFEIMVELSARVDPPDVHVGKGFVSGALAEEQRVGVPFRVQSGDSEPGEAYAAIRYLDHWFWIPNHDEESKVIFVFLMLLSSLAESGEGKIAPVVTVPTG